MGNVCSNLSPGKKTVNAKVDDTNNSDKQAPAVSGAGEVRVLMTCLDYKQTENPLTCTIDGDNMQDLLSACGITDITYLKDEECTKENVVAKIQDIAGRCSGDDFFVFYYSGHGTSVPDKDGDEADGSDEALCFVTADGQVSYESCLIDDDFADAVTSCLHDETHFLILTDCCHSGTIADLKSEQWASHKVVAVAGCTDSQTSGDIGKGGIMTHSMLFAIQELLEEGDNDYTVAALYNRTLDRDDNVFDSEQDISISASPGFKANQMSWPLIPSGDYVAPLNR